jgi:mono/diheme cytochrome c family protein
MSDVSPGSFSQNPAGEPAVTRSSAPMWIIVVTLALLFFGGLYLDSHGGWGAKNLYAPFKSVEQLEAFQPSSGAAMALSRGKASYDAVCGICHGPDGLGKPGQAPALAGSEWVVTKNFNRLAHIPLAGISGPIKVGGKDWNLAMAAMGAALPDENLAAVLTYIRSSWGNQAGPVTADDVKKIRAQIGGNPQPLTGEQLKALAE